MSVDRYAHHRPDVLRLRAQGESFRAIGKELKIGSTTAWRLVSPENERAFQASTLASRARTLTESEQVAA